MEIFVAAVVAGMIYVLVPGPATLATLSLSATRGRASAFRFLAAHLVGDVAWSCLALLAIVGISRLGSELFDWLGIACGLYLIWLGAKALLAKGDGSTPIVVNPWRSGLVFGLSNPKAYPFALAMLTAILGQYGANLTLSSSAIVLVGCLTGFIFADLIVIYWTGLAVIRRFFLRHARRITRATGLIFIAFGAKSIIDASSAMRAR
ncbi:MAG: LysE family translocator [Bosea sp. (in: a-proteobacteria)]